MRIGFLLALALLLQGCVAAKRGPGAVEALQRLPPVVGAFARVPLSATIGPAGDARQVAITGYRQIGGVSSAAIIVPNAPDPRAADGFGGAGMTQALEQALTTARLVAQREGGVLTVRNSVTGARNNVPLLRCWVAELSPAPGVPPRAVADTLRTECAGLVVDRFVTFSGRSANTAAEMNAVIGLGMTLVQVLGDPNAPVTTVLREIPRGGGAGSPGGVPGGVPGVVPGGALPEGANPPQARPVVPPGNRLGRGYSF